MTTKSRDVKILCRPLQSTVVTSVIAYLKNWVIRSIIFKYLEEPHIIPYNYMIYNIRYINI